MSGLSWFGIVRLGLVQTALGAIVVLTTSTINRVMVVELALPAMVPGFLVGVHYVVQVMRPLLGHGSDLGGRRTPWIVGGMATLAIGGVGAAIATAIIPSMPVLGLGTALVAFVLVGLGVGASGTSLLVLLAKRTAPDRRAAAATIVWVMMIAGFIVTALLAGQFLDPFSLSRLVAVSASVSAIAFVTTLIAVWRVERDGEPLGGVPTAQRVARESSFKVALHQVWSERESRLFTVFVFVSMLAYSAQDLILEPFAGIVFGFTPGESTKLAGLQHAGVLAGMMLVGAITLLSARRGGALFQRLASLRLWTVVGCAASALALLGLAFGGWIATDPGGLSWPLKQNVLALGVANGAFAVAAIGSMMQLVSSGHRAREGVRMGLWGAAQALAFGLGGFLGAAAYDFARTFFDAPNFAYATVFAVEGALFAVSALLALWISGHSRERAPRSRNSEVRLDQPLKSI